MKIPEFDQHFFEHLELEDALRLADRYFEDTTPERIEAWFTNFVEDFTRHIGHYYHSLLRYYKAVLVKHFREQYNLDSYNEMIKSKYDEIWEPYGEALTRCDLYGKNQENRAHAYQSKYIHSVPEKSTSDRKKAEYLSPQHYWLLWFNSVINNPPEVQKELAALDYDDYSKTSHFQRVRTALLIAYLYKCYSIRCNGGPYFGDDMQDLLLYHKSKENLGNERYEDVTLLCRRHYKAAQNGVEIEPFGEFTF